MINNNNKKKKKKKKIMIKKRERYRIRMGSSLFKLLLKNMETFGKKNNKSNNIKLKKWEL